VAEVLTGEAERPGFAPLMDPTTMVVPGGKERNLKEFQALFDAAGFRLTAVKPTSTPFVLVEALAR
jgi:hypothetical protein